MTQPRLSIVTVVRNSLPLLRKTVASLREQRDQSFQYVIIDGASTDNTRDFALSRPEPASIVISEPDCGIYAAMNKAPALCSGEYIQYLNAGDTLCTPDTTSSVLPYLDGQADIVIFNYRIRGKRYAPVLSLRRLLGGFPCHQAIFYRRKYLHQYPFATRLKYCADYHHLLNSLPRSVIRIADPVVIDYDITGLSSQPHVRRSIRLERAWSAWSSNLSIRWRLVIAGYNLLRYLR